MEVKLRQARRKAGLTQQALAEKIGTGRSHISALERGAADMSLRMARRIAEHLDVDAADLIVGTGSKDAVDQRKDVLLAVEGWVERVVQVVLDDGARMNPPRPIEVSARLIAYFAVRQECRFELDLYEERSLDGSERGTLINARH